MKKILVFLSPILFSLSLSAMSHEGVFFKNLKDGQTIDKKVTIKFGVKGMKVKPAGKLTDGTGHFHLIIDKEPAEKGKVVPSDEHHIHYGKGQKQATVTLEPGKRQLTLQFADGAHRSLGKEWLKTITVNVKK